MVFFRLYMQVDLSALRVTTLVVTRRVYILGLNIVTTDRQKESTFNERFIFSIWL